MNENKKAINVGGVKIGGGNFVRIAGPCSIESEEQIIEIAKAVKSAGFFIIFLFWQILSIYSAPFSIALMSIPTTAAGNKPTGQSSENLPPTPSGI